MKTTQTIDIAPVTTSSHSRRARSKTVNGRMDLVRAAVRSADEKARGAETTNRHRCLTGKSHKNAARVRTRASGPVHGFRNPAAALESEGVPPDRFGERE